MPRHSRALTGTFTGTDRQRWYPPAVEQRYRELGCWTDELIGDAPRRWARDTPDTPAVTDADGTVTYAELEDRVARLASGFAEQGIDVGDRVVLQLGNRVRFIEVFLALQRLGAVPVMSLTGHRGHDLDAFVSIADAVAHVCEARAPGANLRSVADALVERHPQLRVFIDSDDAGNHTPLATIRSETGATGAAAVRATDLGLLQLSGGSTGTPKLIPRTHADYLFSIRESNRICHVDSGTVYLCVLPVAHNFAVSSPGWLGVLLAGGHVVMAPDPSATTCMRLIELHGVTITGVVPPVALLWLDAAARTLPSGSGPDLSSLEVLQVGGAKLSESVARRVPDTLGCTLQQVFGMAEGLVSYTRDDDPWELVATTQGRPISDEHDEVLLVDDSDRPVPDGEPGHLLTRGPYTIRGYLGADEVNAESFTHDGFYRTGDIARRVGRNLQVTGRSKDQINRGGEKIAPEEVENLLLSHPSVLEAHVRGIRDEVLGERIQAWIIPRPATSPAVQDLRRHLIEQGIATFKMPDRIELCSELPRTAVGKTATEC